MTFLNANVLAIIVCTQNCLKLQATTTKCTLLYVHAHHVSWSNVWLIRLALLSFLGFFLDSKFQGDKWMGFTDCYLIYSLVENSWLHWSDWSACYMSICMKPSFLLQTCDFTNHSYHLANIAWGTLSLYSTEKYIIFKRPDCQRHIWIN